MQKLNMRRKKPWLSPLSLVKLAVFSPGMQGFTGREVKSIKQASSVNYGLVPSFEVHKHQFRLLYGRSNGNDMLALLATSGMVGRAEP